MERGDGSLVLRSRLLAAFASMSTPHCVSAVILGAAAARARRRRQLQELLTPPDIAFGFAPCMACWEGREDAALPRQTFDAFCKIRT